MNEELLEKINDAVAAMNDAQGELVSRSKTVGLLLLEAKKLHPKVKDFDAFLEKVHGLPHRSRAYDLMRIAGGRATDEELKKDARERQRRHREKKKKTSRPIPQPLPNEPFRDVTETAEESAERRKAENSELELSPDERAAKQSAHYLAEFTAACHLYLPRITLESDRQRARGLVFELLGGALAQRREAA